MKNTYRDQAEIRRAVRGGRDGRSLGGSHGGSLSSSWSCLFATLFFSFYAGKEIRCQQSLEMSVKLRLFAGHAEGQLDILQRYDVLRMQQEKSLFSSLYYVVATLNVSLSITIYSVEALILLTLFSALRNKSTRSQ